MRRCPFCGSCNTEENKKCMICGRELTPEKDERSEKTTGTAAAESGGTGKPVSTSGFFGSMGKTHYMAGEAEKEPGDMHTRHVSGSGLMGSMGKTSYDMPENKTGPADTDSRELGDDLYGTAGEKTYRAVKGEKAAPPVEKEAKFFGHMGEKTYKTDFSHKAEPSEKKEERSGPSVVRITALHGRMGSKTYEGEYEMRDGTAGYGGHEPPPPRAVKWLTAACLVLAVLMGLAAFLLRFRDEQQPENYFVPVNEENIQEEDGVQFIPNQLVVVVKNGVSEKEAEKLFSAYGLSVVGYIELMDTYQLRLGKQMPLNDLTELARQLSEDFRVETASVDLVWKNETDAFPNDPWSENVASTARWDDVNGNNWGVKAINAPYCWDNYDLGTVKVGIIDSMFYPEHEDLSAQFSVCRYNEIFDTYVPKNQYDSCKEHGTHVAGIIGATHNNGRGLSGILEDSSIYAYALWGFDGNMDVLSAIAELSSSGARVVNYSIGYNKDIVLAAAEGDSGIRSYYYEEVSAIKEAALLRLLQKGNDFLFVAAAGNNGVDAVWGSEFTYIRSPEIKSRILVVGAAENINECYSLALFSNNGQRLDVTAPGVQIFSALPYNEYDSWDGTSMAAPHVTGVCASVWAAAPELTGAQVKEIVVSTADIPVIGNCPNMVNMQAAMEWVSPVSSIVSPAPTQQPSPEPTPGQENETERQQALLAYAELLNDGITLDISSFGQRTVNVTHYYLFEMDGDGIEEMIAYASPGAGEWTFAIYSYKNGRVIQIADAVNTCDIAQWSNCKIIIRITNGILNAYAGKATAAYSSESDNYLYYDGRSVTNYQSQGDVPKTTVKNDFLLVNGMDNYGIAIGSEDDVLRKLYLENHPA